MISASFAAWGMGCLRYEASCVETKYRHSLSPTLSAAYPQERVAAPAAPRVWLRGPVPLQTPRTDEPHPARHFPRRHRCVAVDRVPPAAGGAELADQGGHQARIVVA